MENVVGEDEGLEVKNHLIFAQPSLNTMLARLAHNPLQLLDSLNSCVTECSASHCLSQLVPRQGVQRHSTGNEEGSKVIKSLELQKRCLLIVPFGLKTASIPPPVFTCHLDLLLTTSHVSPRLRISRYTIPSDTKHIYQTSSPALPEDRSSRGRP